MADTTAIEWCDSTFNPWIGCTAVSPACDHCYAARSTPARTLGIAWGSGQPRHHTSSTTWSAPIAWQRQAPAFLAQHGRRRRVFCASLADVFDNEVPDDWRDELALLINKTPDLDWLLVTKRIGNVMGMAQRSGLLLDLLQARDNVWLGITVANQPELVRDLHKLQATPAAVHFLSVEPMLGPIDLVAAGAVYIDTVGRLVDHRQSIDWVICGGESGRQARPMHPDWARSLRDQCARAGVPFLFKQWGAWTEQDDSGLPGVRTAIEGDPEFEAEAAKCDAFMAMDGQLITDLEDARDDVPYRGLIRLDKKAAGRMLDGRTHDEFPS